jgi:hypothetical protein
VRLMALQNDPDAARDAVRTAAVSLDPITDEQIDIDIVDGTTGVDTTAETCPVTGAGSTAVRLTIEYPMPYLTGFFGTGLELTGTGVMRCNG